MALRQSLFPALSFPPPSVGPIAGGAEMAHRSVEIQITNSTRDITLRNPRSYCYSGYSSSPPSPIIQPGDTGCCTFNNTPARLRGSVGVLVYEAETFTLAILFSNPFDYNLYSMEFAVEISPEKAHVGQLQDVYNRMYRGLPANPNNTGMFQLAKLSDTQETSIVSAGGTKVTATMSTAANSIIKVVVENQEIPPPYSKAK
ncbi:DELTA-sagatoxin-Srs1a-like isoform X2 [Coturnix japonica]|uniref:DELTA-sagatoxin-Srs1a-like isoform X2 n=1 Tax=Coturnix japonica TaxID=93934 RepID=UPI000777C656|nr:DELTA-sagatoxin-Srs1a-like isoform X2 [Coturnix japonica]